MSAQLRAVCEFCPRKSRWQDEDPEYPGRLPFWDIAAGWSVAPYSLGFEHPDGMHGDRWMCPTCNRKMRAGAVLKPRAVECTERRVRRKAGGSAVSPRRREPARGDVVAAQDA